MATDCDDYKDMEEFFSWLQPMSVCFCVCLISLTFCLPTTDKYEE